MIFQINHTVQKITADFSNIRTVHRYCWWAAIIVYFWSAYSNIGYIHYDEHYQIIEFALIKSGTNSPFDMAWEYDAGIRSSLQPAICFCIITCLKKINVTDPYTIGFILRMISAFLALMVIRVFVVTHLDRFGSGFKKLFIFVSYFFWFLPYINVRFSSESWAGIMFILGYILLQNHTKSKPFHLLIAGLVIGISILFRIQMALASFGLIMWLIFIQRRKQREITFIILGIVAAIIFGALIDFWYYEKPTFVLWHYLKSFFLSNQDAVFGVSPWYYYFLKILVMPIVPMGAIIIILTMYFFALETRSPVTWIVLPFFFVHTLIPHKELRFLFPLVNFIPFIIIMAAQSLNRKRLITNSPPVQIFVKGIIILIIIANTICLAVSSNSPSGDGAKYLTYLIARRHPNTRIEVLFDTRYNAFNPLARYGISDHFYSGQNIKFTTIQQVLNLGLKCDDEIPTYLIVKGSLINSSMFHSIFTRYKWQLVAASLPMWYVKMINSFNPDEKIDPVFLYVRS